jgi:hypothetical protein
MSSKKLARDINYMLDDNIKNVLEIKESLDSTDIVVAC